MDLVTTHTDNESIHYCFPNNNLSCTRNVKPGAEYIFVYIFISTISVFTVFLNLLVIISIAHFKQLHTPTNVLIFSLAVADLIVGLILMPVQAIRLIETCWYFGDTLCGLFMLIMGVLLTASISNLVLIAIDRYMAVCHPLLYPQKITTTKTLISICLCWFWSSSYSVAYAVSNGYFNTSNTFCYGQCIVMFSPAWRFTDLTISFLYPCTVIITVYLRIFYVAQQQMKVINAMTGEKCVMVSVRRKSENKAALTLGIIVTVYLFCWIPYYICTLTETTAIPSNSMTFLTWTFYINSSVNPLIYALFYRWFKVSIKHILTLRIFQPASSLVDIFTDYNSHAPLKK
uniref:G-protein coupled receptors family 1 profile domain-containing protein n=1 Tax=Cyprinus carpio TaxID=7962 RepID=A0A8C1Z238_CYPCA